MIKRLLSFLDASPVNFLAVKNISEELEKNGFRRMNPQEPLGKIEAGEKFFVTKNDSSIYAFQIGKKPLARPKCSPAVRLLRPSPFPLRFRQSARALSKAVPSWRP